MISDPPFEYPLRDGWSCVAVADGKYNAYLDRDAALEFLFGLHWFAKDKPVGEEVDIWSRNCEEMQCDGEPIGLCELTLVDSHLHKKRGKTILKNKQDLRIKEHGIYTQKHGRLDYYVSPEEALQAYETLARFLYYWDKHGRKAEVTLFGTLNIKLVSPKMIQGRIAG